MFVDFKLCKLKWDQIVKKFVQQLTVEKRVQYVDDVL